MLKLNTLSGFGSGAAATGFNTKAIDLIAGEFLACDGSGKTLGFSNAWTIIVWAKPLNIAGTDGLVNPYGLAASLKNRIQLFFLYGEIQIKMWNTESALFKDYITTNTPVAATTIIQVGITWDGTNLAIYADGAVIGSGDITKTVDNASSQVDDGDRGIRFSGEGNFGGLHSTTAIWDVALSAASLAATYDSGSGFNLDLRDSSGSYTETANLQHLWPVGADSGDIGQDLGVATAIDLMAGNVNVSAADVVDFV
ncbi:MAG: hypothetical protein QF535_16530 [Anaerolineales bacterium]|jgi:hypothetical protein|nr:hypothetical protein [Anaerolineales bacterium]|tara:strand:+ start:43 stop:804 length:762 start_codon:yes stop_codon:yes gene_type:complete